MNSKYFSLRVIAELIRFRFAVNLFPQSLISKIIDNKDLLFCGKALRLQSEIT